MLQTTMMTTSFILHQQLRRRILSSSITIIIDHSPGLFANNSVFVRRRQKLLSIPHRHYHHHAASTTATLSSASFFFSSPGHNDSCCWGTTTGHVIMRRNASSKSSSSLLSSKKQKEERQQRPPTMAVFDPDDHADEVDFHDDHDEEDGNNDDDDNSEDEDDDDDSPRRNKKSKKSKSSTSSSPSSSSSSPYTNRRRKTIPAADDFVDDDDESDDSDDDEDRPQRKKKSKSKTSSSSSSSSSESSSTSSSSLLLRPADVIYQDNHLLVVNKPPGYHCGPNHNRNDRLKCILNHLLARKLGGGQHGRRVLRPLHRIDQPCSGVLLLGRSSRVGPRLQPIWTLVRKTYVVVVTPTSSAGWTCMRLALSSEQQRKYWRRLIGTMAGKNATKLKGGGWSVHMIPGMVAGKGRTVQLDWTLVGPDVPPTAVAHDHHPIMDNNHLLLDGTRFVLLIRTTQGARHMVRALLSAYGLAIVGDTRYNRANGPRTTANGSSGSHSIGGRNLHGEGIYYDRSWPFVALHARGITLPSVLELPGNRGMDVDGTVMTPQARTFTATLPTEWHDHFHLREEYLATVEKEASQYPYDVKAERVMGGGGRGMNDEMDEWTN